MPSSFRFDYAVDPTSSAPCGAHFSMEISMQKQPECCHEDLSVRGGLEEAVRLLAGELRAVRADVLRERRRVRGLAVVLAGVLVVTGWSVLPSLSIAEAQSAASHQARPMRDICAAAFPSVPWPGAMAHPDMAPRCFRQESPRRRPSRPHVENNSQQSCGAGMRQPQAPRTCPSWRGAPWD